MGKATMSVFSLRLRRLISRLRMYVRLRDIIVQQTYQWRDSLSLVIIYISLYVGVIDSNLAFSDLLQPYEKMRK